MYTFVTGGYRSGRSNYALRRAAELGPPPWLYVSAGVETDDAIRKRIERHRKDAEAIWRTALMPADARALVAPGALDGYGAAVFDGMTAWLEARLGAGPSDPDAVVLDEIAEFADRMYRSPVPIVVVSGEMNMGGPPARPELLRFAKLGASGNQILAQHAASVVMMVSGLPLKVR